MILFQYVGESERMVRQVFIQAKDAAPSVIYFDEIDSLCEKRDSNEASLFMHAAINMLAQILAIIKSVWINITFILK